MHKFSLLSESLPSECFNYLHHILS